MPKQQSSPLAAADVSAIRVVDVKNKPVSYMLDVLKTAQDSGVPYIDIINRGLPILHLGFLDSLPKKWQYAEKRELPLTDLKRSKISLIGITRDRIPFVLTRKAGPPLALWPIDKGYTRPSMLTTQEQLDYQDRQLRRLERRLQHTEKKLEQIEKNLSAIGGIWKNLFDPRKVGKTRTDNEEGNAEQE